MNDLIKKAFTLIEFLVVIAIIGILSGMIVVSMSATTEKATIAKSQVFSNSLRNALMLNLISEWKFDGPTSAESNITINDVKDSWGVNNATSIGSNPIIKDGSNCFYGKCGYFDGAGDYVSINDITSSSLDVTDAITISTWINRWCKDI